MDTLIYSSDALFQNSVYFELTMGALIRKLVKLIHFSQEWNASVLFLLVIHILHQQETWLKILNRYWKKQFSFFLIRSDIHTSSHFLGTKEWHAGCYRKQEQVKKKMQVLCPPTNWKTEWQGLIYFFLLRERMKGKKYSQYGSEPLHSPKASVFVILLWTSPESPRKSYLAYDQRYWGKNPQVFLYYQWVLSD